MNWKKKTTVQVPSESLELNDRGCRISISISPEMDGRMSWVYAKPPCGITFGVLVDGTPDEVAPIALGKLIAKLELALAELRGVTEAQS